MPSSSLAVAGTIVNLVHTSGARRILDVGPGFGKYGLLLREYVGSIDDPNIGRRVGPIELLDAVEAEARYVKAMPWLRAIYDQVMVDVSIVDVPQGTLDAYDLVLMVDVLEHLDHDDGIDVLARIPGWIVVCTPRDFFQNPEADRGWETERHRSHWSARMVERAVAPRPCMTVPNDVGAVIVRVAPKEPT